MFIEHAMSWLEDKQTAAYSGKVIVIGMSRGGVRAVIFAKCLNDGFRHAKAFVFAIDPVQGAHAGLNDGSFDMRSSRNGMKGSRDERAHASALAGKCDQEGVAARRAPGPGEPVAQDPEAEIRAELVHDDPCHGLVPRLKSSNTWTSDRGEWLRATVLPIDQE